MPCKHGVLWPDDSGCPVCNAEKNRAVPVSREVLAELQRDAARWREHANIMKASGIDGALLIRLIARSNAGEVASIEAVLDSHALGHGVLGLKAIGMACEQKAAQLFAHIDAAMVPHD